MELFALVGIIVVIAVVCGLLDIPDRFQKLLYVLCAVLVIIFVANYFFGFGGHGVVLK